MAFLMDETHKQTVAYWWQDIAVALDPIVTSIKQSSAGLTQGEIEAKLDDIHHAYVMAHRVEIPLTIKAQLIASICNLQMSFCARYEGQKRVSSKHHRIAQVEWILFTEMVQKEGIHAHILQ